MCFLKELGLEQRPIRVDNPKVTSGLPCRKKKRHRDNDHAGPDAKMTATFDLPNGTLKKKANGEWDNGDSFGLLYCFVLMIPDSYEQGLLAMQYAMSANIFGCGAYAVFSNVTLMIAKGLETKKIDSDLQCEKGGEFGTALNTDIFMQVWKSVIIDGEYAHHDWTVKTDPDTVFLPQRLRPILKMYEPHDKKDGVYLNNCRMGMHGPLEVLSRNAIHTWGAGARTCFDYFYDLCSGPCLWGEDMFMDQCLKQVLNVSRINVYTLLIEEHCDPKEDWDSCLDPMGVSFHPFKKANAYKECLSNALNVSASEAAEGREGIRTQKAKVTTHASRNETSVSKTASDSEVSDIASAKNASAPAS